MAEKCNILAGVRYALNDFIIEVTYFNGSHGLCGTSGLAPHNGYGWLYSPRKKEFARAKWKISSQRRYPLDEKQVYTSAISGAVLQEIFWR
jgi:hypothetical protein